MNKILKLNERGRRQIGLKEVYYKNSIFMQSFTPLLPMDRMTSYIPILCYPNLNYFSEGGSGP